MGNQPMKPTNQEIAAMMKRLAFIVECVAHLQGREVELLPTADAAREMIRKLENKQ